MAYKRISPIPVPEGGTGNKTLAIHGVLLGEAASPINSTVPGTTGQVLIGSTGADPAFNSLGVNSGLTANGVLLGNNNTAITATAAGTTGQVLTGVTGSPPTFQSLPASSITITGDSGGGLTGNSFTFTGGTTGLTFAGAVSTETLGGTLAVKNGGTGAVTFAADGVLYGNGTSAIAATSVGTAGQVLTSNGAGNAPTFQTSTVNLVLIQSQTASNSASLSFTTGITTTYKTYMLVYSGVYPVTQNAVVGLQISTNGGSSYINANYASGANFFVWNSGAVTNYDSSTYMNLTGQQNNANLGSSIAANGTVYLQNWTNGSYPSLTGVWSGENSTVFGGGTICAAYYTATAVVNAFQIVASTGNISTGTFTLYGVLE